MIIVFQERTRGSGVYFQRSMLSRKERVGRLTVDWYDGRWVSGVKNCAYSLWARYRQWRVKRITRRALNAIRTGTPVPFNDADIYPGRATGNKGIRFK